MGWIFYILVFMPVVGVTVTDAVHTISLQGLAVYHSDEADLPH